MGPEAKKNAETFVITDEQFNAFLKRHSSVPQLVPESNEMMRESYLILDEYVSQLTIVISAHHHKFPSIYVDAIFRLHAGKEGSIEINS